MMKNRLIPLWFIGRGGDMVFYGVEGKERLWHLRFEHLNYKILSIISPLVYGL